MLKIDRILNVIRDLEELERKTEDNEQLMEIGVRIKNAKAKLTYTYWGSDYAHFNQEDLHLDRRWIMKGAIPGFVKWISDLYVDDSQLVELPVNMEELKNVQNRDN